MVQIKIYVEKQANPNPTDSAQAIISITPKKRKQTTTEKMLLVDEVKKRVDTPHSIIFRQIKEGHPCYSAHCPDNSSTDILIFLHSLLLIYKYFWLVWTYKLITS